jgi:hypothetical protein
MIEQLTVPDLEEFVTFASVASLVTGIFRGPDEILDL